jgi:hypothetical protein
MLRIVSVIELAFYLVFVSVLAVNSYLGTFE